jgi:hypothetical protein
MRMKCRYSELLRGKRNLTVAAGNASGCDRVSDVEGEDGSSWGVGELGENGIRSWLLRLGNGRCSCSCDEGVFPL